MNREWLIVAIFLVVALVIIVITHAVVVTHLTPIEISTVRTPLKSDGVPVPEQDFGVNISSLVLEPLPRYLQLLLPVLLHS